MDNEKIASELVKVAESLTADKYTRMAEAFARWFTGDAEEVRGRALKDLKSMQKQNILDQSVENQMALGPIFDAVSKEINNVLKRNAL